ncbi:TIGR01777 family oxidoreductase [Halobacillus shinanisalinarum]|uniref:TIGR01777 family oxidoreductase n=1 Tax=Halobacillus shinanisalinarum TaxID=2932258 RepID=A0ABY4GWU2_9BACI|nr:TIGR01777 family oxidoreductase [Halobacillus shinanisalinarum]UOQ92608.1 TIGR01777 family oxidoreductase [Halobacillus shinanisalinarum]
MKIAITGGTGFVGSKLTQKLINEDHHVYILTRNPDKHENTDHVTHIGWLKDEYAPWDHLPSVDAIVNLAGESLNSGRWTEERKKSILDSRIRATEEVINLIERMNPKPEALINASAVGFYGQSETTTFTEETVQPGKDFLANVVAKWENRAAKAQSLGVRTAFIRFGVILGEKGALPKMTIPYKLMIGGNLGSGEQWMSWIHIDDVIELIDYSLKTSSLKGPVNGTAPNPKRNKDFGQTLGNVLGRPHWIPAPSFALKTILGDMSTLLLNGQSVIPKKAITHGYTFIFPELNPALQSILKS